LDSELLTKYNFLSEENRRRNLFDTYQGEAKLSEIGHFAVKNAAVA
jgi:hypothetical protein